MHSADGFVPAKNKTIYLLSCCYGQLLLHMVCVVCFMVCSTRFAHVMIDILANAYLLACKWHACHFS